MIVNLQTSRRFVSNSNTDRHRSSCRCWWAQQCIYTLLYLIGGGLLPAKSLVLDTGCLELSVSEGGGDEDDCDRDDGAGVVLDLLLFGFLILVSL